LQIDVFSLFPEWFDWMRRPRHLANAAISADLELRCFSFRDTTPLRNGQVDDAPYGGGPGMVIRVDVVAAALDAVYGSSGPGLLSDRRVAVLTPRGRPFDDRVARELAGLSSLTLLCGRYEGFDERVHTQLANDGLCLGPFVLAGGETAAMAMIDALCRRLPGALGNAESLDRESFSESLHGGVEHPHYTRPHEFRGWSVPDVLRSGDHGAVEAWRQANVGSPPSAWRP
jgi:tRNA (guanine37-N1)-methyltransferase